MKIRTFGILAAATLAVLLPVVSGSFGDEREDDHERARELYEHGEIQSLRDVLQEIAKQIQGDVVGVELVQAGDRWVYRFQVIDPQGRRTFVDIDARSDAVGDDEEDDD